MRFIYFVIFLLLDVSFNSTYAQSLGKNKCYSFNNIYNSWNALNLPKIKESVDKKVLWNGQFTSKIVIPQKYIDVTRKRLFIFSKYIPTESNSKSKCMYFNCKSDFACCIYFKTYSLNKHEEIVDRDSMFVALNKSWQKVSINLPTHKSEELYMEISFESDSNRQSEYDRNLWTDKLNIITTKEYESKSIQSFSKRRIGNIINLTSNSDSCIGKITPFHDHKIIALAETVHGSRSLNRCACQIIRRSVEKENCKV